MEALVALALAGCGGPPALRLDSVEPGRVQYGVPCQVQLMGAFNPRLELDMGAKGQTKLVDDFRVWVGQEPITPVRLRALNQLDVTLPGDLPPGLYDVQVADPRGKQVMLAKGLEVFVKPPAQIAFVTSMRAAGVDTWTEPIRIELRDDAGGLTLAPTPRDIRVFSDSPDGRFSIDGGKTTVLSLDLPLPAGASGASFSFMNSSAGYDTLEASTDGLPPISQPVVVGHLGQAARVRFVGQRAPVMTAGTASPVTMEIEDAAGGPAVIPAQGIRVDLAGGATLALSSNPGGPFAPALSWVLHEGQGRAVVYVRGEVAGPGAQLQALATELGAGRALVPDSLFLSVLHGPLSGFSVLRSSAADASVGVPEHFTVRAVDAFGNTVDDWSGPVTLGASPAGSPGTGGPGAVGANVVNGSLEQDVSFTRAQQTVLVVSDQAAPPHGGLSTSFWVRPGPFVGYFLSTPDSSQVAGVPFSVTLAALDAYGNPVPEPHQISLSAPGLPAGALSPATSGPFAGSAILQVTLTQAASNLTLVASDGSAQVTTGSFAVLPGSTQRFEVSNVSGSQTAGTPFAVTVRALDAYGNETQDTNDVALAVDGGAQGAVAPATSGSFVGHVTLQVAVTEALSGTRLSVSCALASGQQTSSFDVVAGPHARFDLFPPSCVRGSTGFVLNVQASDQYGNLVTGYGGTVRFSAQTQFSPGQSPLFSSGKVSILNATVSRVGTVPRTVLVQAVDTLDPSKTGSVVLNVQASCP